MASDAGDLTPRPRPSPRYVVELVTVAGVLLLAGYRDSASQSLADMADELLTATRNDDGR